jgi:hypothetical protein
MSLDREHHRAILDNPHKGGSHLALLLVIATYTDPRGEWLADQATLERHACLSRRQIRRVLADLVASGDLAVETHHGRGHRSRYRLLRIPGNRPPETPFPPPALVAHAPFLARKADTTTTFSLGKPAPHVTFSGPRVPPFPRTPNPPLTPQKQQQETCGLPPPAAPAPPQSDQQGTLFTPLPFGAGGGGTHGRGAGGEGPGGGKLTRSEAPPRPLTTPQSAVFRVNLLLEEAAVPLPTPAQITLWAKTLGGIDPLLGLLRRLIAAGLATKKTPHVYIHRVVLNEAAHPEPKRSEPQRFQTGRRPSNPLLTAGADDRRRELGRLIAAKRPV